MRLELFVADSGLAARLEQAPPRLIQYLNNTVEIITADGETAVVAHTPVGATGHLRQSITHEVSTSGVLVEGRIYSTDVPVKVASVERGRAPGKMPPIAPIALWVQRKLGVDDVESVAFLIARAIGRRGTKGSHMFEKGFADLQQSVARRVGSLADDIRRLI